MIYDLSLNSDCLRAEVYLGKLIKDCSPCEIRKINPKRTKKQNRYLHALFTIFGGEFGYSGEEAKVVVKRQLGYTYEKNGQWFLKHTADFNTKQMTEFVHKFRNWSAHQGCYLPTPQEFDDNYVEMMKKVAEIEAVQSRYSY